MRQRGRATPKLLAEGGFITPLLFVVLLVVVGGAYYLWKTNKFLIAPPGCHYDKVQCVMAPCDPVLICGSNSSTTQTTLASPSATPIVDETANWKTYTNKTYKYEIKLPDNYIVPPQTEKEKSQLGIDTNICIEEKSITACEISIVYTNMSIEEFLKVYGVPNNSQPTDYSNANVKGKMYIDKSHKDLTDTRIAIPLPNSNTGILVIIYTNFPNDPLTPEIKEKILSTFKFTQ